MIPDYDTLRQQMVTDIAAKGILDKSVIESMLSVPRHLFVSPELQRYAYDDRPLAIGNEQVITQPSLVARMVQSAHVNPSSIVLEIGTGSGYAAAVLSRITKKVYTIERMESFVADAKKRFLGLGYNNIYTKCGDGSLGWAEFAPYDAIVVSAGAPSIPQCYIDQLKIGGKLVIPVGGRSDQDLVCYHKKGADMFYKETIDYVRFVPLIGEEGWPD